MRNETYSLKLRCVRHPLGLSILFPFFVAGLVLTGCGAYEEEEELPRAAGNGVTSTTSAADTVAASAPPGEVEDDLDRVVERTVADCIEAWNTPENAVEQKAIAERGSDQVAHVSASAGPYSIDEPKDSSDWTNDVPLATLEECVVFFSINRGDDTGPSKAFVYSEGAWRELDIWEIAYTPTPPTSSPDDDSDVTEGIGVAEPEVRVTPNATVEPDGTLKLKDTEKESNDPSDTEVSPNFAVPPTTEECIAAWNAPENGDNQREVAEGGPHGIASGSSVWVNIRSPGSDQVSACVFLFHRGRTFFKVAGLREGDQFHWSTVEVVGDAGLFRPVDDAVVQPDGTLKLKETERESNASAGSEPGLDSGGATMEECFAAWNAPENAHTREAAAGGRYRIALVGDGGWAEVTVAASGLPAFIDSGLFCSVWFFGEEGNYVVFEGREKASGFEWKRTSWELDFELKDIETGADAVVQVDGRLTPVE